MSYNPNSPQEPSDQYSNKQGWLSNEFGLQPLNAIEKVLKHLIKAFAYQFGWDENSSIWRAIRTDIAGNTKTTNGTQSLLPPTTIQYVLDTTLTQVLTLNSNRSSFTIVNQTGDGTDPANGLFIVYPNPLSSTYIYLPAGFMYTDDNWSGNVSVQIAGSGTGATILVTEYF